MSETINRGYLRRIFKSERIVCAFVGSMIMVLMLVTTAFAVPDISGLKITDVTPNSFSVVWMTDVQATAGVEIYSDGAGINRITDSLVVTPMPSGSAEVAQAALSKGIVKVRVSGLSATTQYYVMAVTKEAANPANIAYSPLYRVQTTSTVRPYLYDVDVPQGFSNDLADFKVYVRPKDMGTKPGIGDLIILEGQSLKYPVSIFAGDGSAAPEGVLDMNNLFGQDGVSLLISGGEKIMLTVYRGVGLTSLSHYRIIPQNSGMASAAEPLKGFFADINLDGRVDDLDFAEFKRHYRSLPDDENYNPDFNFVEDPDARVDAREFSRFAKEYGRTDVK